MNYKLRVLGAALLLAAALAGCGTSPAPSNGAAAAAQSAATAAPAPSAQAEENATTSAAYAPATSAPVPAAPTPEANSSSSVVSAEAAKQTALARVSGATASDIYEWETDHDDGRTEYQGKIIYAGTEYEFTIDAATGSIIEWESEPVD